jgi:pyridoxal phosphate enzyme (YggS family)
MNTTLSLEDIKSNIDNLYNNILLSKKNAINNYEYPTIIAVSKNQDTNTIIKAIKCGITNFAENYVQEAYGKWVDIKQQYPFVKLHFIGALQSNKTAQALEIFDFIQTIDRVKLARVISKSGVIANKNFFIQVNLDSNKQAGCLIKDIPDLLLECKNLGLPIVGLMAILPAKNLQINSNHTAPYFALLKKLTLENKLQYCSMGMSDDYLEAVKFGANHLRVGSAIFKKGII